MPAPTIDELRAACEAFGMNDSDLARALGLSRPTVYRWMSGKFKPDGLAGVVLGALVLVAQRLPADQARAVGAELKLGLGALIYARLIRAAEASR